MGALCGAAQFAIGPDVVVVSGQRATAFGASGPPTCAIPGAR